MLQLLAVVGALVTQPCKAFSSSEQGVKQADLTANSSYMSFHKSLFKDAQIMVQIICPQQLPGKAGSFQIGWLLRQSPCAEEYTALEEDPKRVPMYFDHLELMQINEFTYTSVNVKQYPVSGATEKTQCLVCQPGHTLTLPNLAHQPPVAMSVQRSYSAVDQAAGSSSASGGGNATKPVAGSSRRRRAATLEATTKAVNLTPTPKAAAAVAGSNRFGLVTRTWEDGVYLFVLHTSPCCESSDPLECASKRLPEGFRVTSRMEIVNPIGYLSAIDWPLLPFFGSMCLLYLLFGFLWLGLCARYWREMLRIQFCISGVIFLGMLEKALFYAEYQSINSTGVSVRGAAMLAELVSCVKRSVARMLVLIVCLGYGIVKPRLGQLQHKVIALGLVYFVFSAVESSMRSMGPRFNLSRKVLYATIPLAVTDAVICWWIFSSLVQTIRNLRVRRNLVKLSLYRHFTNTLVFCVVCSVVFMAWTVGRHKFAVCITAWREVWIDDAFWHLLFSVILFVIIVLWRPSQNNQRYAFTPLLDVGNDSDDEDEEVVMDNLAEGVKARGQAAQQQQQQQLQRSRNSSKGDESSLRWVEENIPQSLVESTLPSLLHDSDEEVLTTKYEMSKLL